ncbi:hypothetical protein [Acinetobacter sp. ESBL14]|uniref:hypothetical protein n=1 Tax=Acinetobacter sp. ESBL14 TaxID=3077329 RepID=UPI002FC690BE
MYDKLISGFDAAGLYAKGVEIEYVHRGVWYIMTKKQEYLFLSDLYIFREKIN